MSTQRFLIAFVLLLTASLLRAYDLTIDEVTRYEQDGKAYALITLRWKNSWRHERNHDAVWLFLKSQPERGRPWRHAAIAADGHRLIPHDGTPELAIATAPGGAGLLLYPAGRYRGDIHCTLSLQLAEEATGEGDALRAFGLEMVYIPGGANTLGDPDTSAYAEGAFYRVGADGQAMGPYRLERESDLVAIAPREGALHYRPLEGRTGDGRGPLPAAFPKGVAPFFIMKYELTQGAYADFLNTLAPAAAQRRAPVREPGYARHYGSITDEEGRWLAVYPDRPCNWLGWEDLLAYADWAGLRPLTELEYTKACRGNRPIRGGNYAWGSPTRRNVERGLNDQGDLYERNDLSERQLRTDDDNLPVWLGASHYWVMELSSGLWEWTVGLGHPEGRAYDGRHGDGALSADGRADTPGWPREGGFGFRGSGYELPEIDNPLYFRTYSPLAHRPFVDFSDAKRRWLYGGRLVRSSPIAVP